MFGGVIVIHVIVMTKYGDEQKTKAMQQHNNYRLYNNTLRNKRAITKIVLHA